MSMPHRDVARGNANQFQLGTGSVSLPRFRAGGEKGSSVAEGRALSASRQSDSTADHCPYDRCLSGVALERRWDHTHAWPALFLQLEICHREQKGRHWELNFSRLQGDALLHFPHFRGVREARYLLPRPLLRALAGRAPARACCLRVYCLRGVERTTRSQSRKYKWCQ